MTEPGIPSEVPDADRAEQEALVDPPAVTSAGDADRRPARTSRRPTRWSSSCRRARARRAARCARWATARRTRPTSSSRRPTCRWTRTTSELTAGAPRLRRRVPHRRGGRHAVLRSISSRSPSSRGGRWRRRWPARTETWRKCSRVLVGQQRARARRAVAGVQPLGAGSSPLEERPASAADGSVRVGGVAPPEPRTRNASTLIGERLGRRPDCSACPAAGSHGVLGQAVRVVPTPAVPRAMSADAARRSPLIDRVGTGSR